MFSENKSLSLGSQDLNKKEIKTRSRSIEFGVIGCGAAGSQLAVSFNQLGYISCAINTTASDLGKIDLPDENKILLGEIGLGGVGKDMSLAKRIFEESRYDVLKRIEKIFKNKINYLILICGGGGGTGGGIIVPLIDVLRQMNLPIGVIVTLPLDSEGTITKKNALEVIGDLLKLAEAGRIAPLIIADNMQAAKRYGKLSVSKFWKAVDDDIVNSFNIFNIFSIKDTKYTAFDSMDYSKCITTEGCMTIGKVSVTNFDNENCLSDAIRDETDTGVAVAGFELYKATRVASMIIASEKTFDELPMAAIDNAFALLNNTIKAGTIYRGIYEDNTIENKVDIYTIFAGLDAPIKRLQKMKEETSDEMFILDEKKKQRKVLDTTTESKEASAFEKLGRRSF